MLKPRSTKLPRILFFDTGEGVPDGRGDSNLGGGGTSSGIDTIGMFKKALGLEFTLSLSPELLDNRLSILSLLSMVAAASGPDFTFVAPERISSMPLPVKLSLLSEVTR